MKRFLALLAAPIFLLANGKLGLGIDHDTQQMVLELIGAYFVTSKGGEVIIKNAEAKAKEAAAAVGSDDTAAILARAAAAGKDL